MPALGKQALEARNLVRRRGGRAEIRDRRDAAIEARPLRKASLQFVERVVELATRERDFEPLFPAA